MIYEFRCPKCKYKVESYYPSYEKAKSNPPICDDCKVPMKKLISSGIQFAMGNIRTVEKKHAANCREKSEKLGREVVPYSGNEEGTSAREHFEKKQEKKAEKMFNELKGQVISSAGFGEGVTFG